MRAQNSNGSWIPLWFGNQLAASEENPTYGTSRVLLALQELTNAPFPGLSPALVEGRLWLLKAQNSDGGWGGVKDVPSSIEETALAVEALAACARRPAKDPIEPAISRGIAWLHEHTQDSFEPSPIGLYFAKLWYSEKLYPLIFTIAALERAKRILDGNY